MEKILVYECLSGWNWPWTVRAAQITYSLRLNINLIRIISYAEVLQRYLLKRVPIILFCHLISLYTLFNIFNPILSICIKTFLFCFHFSFVSSFFFFFAFHNTIYIKMPAFIKQPIKTSQHSININVDAKKKKYVKNM